jgi:hypothetical protein
MDPANPTLIDQRVIELWLVALILCAASYFGTRWRTWLGIVPLALAALFSLGMWQELSDPATAGGLALDLGDGYLLHSRVASSASFVLAAAACFLAAARSKRRVV